ncbi:hypothetical protein [Neoaquamicrobium sediminum]|uniref:hypothetical protein n=1 Tax=Neoaquamicrobium sediminum TaxID=1849104 RepID=UPI003BA84B66
MEIEMEWSNTTDCRTHAAEAGRALLPAGMRHAVRMGTVDVPYLGTQQSKANAAERYARRAGIFR